MCTATIFVMENLSFALCHRIHQNILKAILISLSTDYQTIQPSDCWLNWSSISNYHTKEIRNLWFHHEPVASFFIRFCTIICPLLCFLGRYATHSIISSITVNLHFTSVSGRIMTAVCRTLSCIMLYHDIMTTVVSSTYLGRTESFVRSAVSYKPLTPSSA